MVVFTVVLLSARLRVVVGGACAEGETFACVREGLLAGDLIGADGDGGISEPRDARRMVRACLDSDEIASSDPERPDC